MKWNLSDNWSCRWDRVWRRGSNIWNSLIMAASTISSRWNSFETVGCICTKVFPIINRLFVFKLENSLELRNIKFLKLSGKSVFGLSVFVLKLFYFNSQNFPEHGLLDCWRRCCNCLSSHASTDLCAPATNTILGTCINLLWKFWTWKYNYYNSIIFYHNTCHYMTWRHDFGNDFRCISFECFIFCTKLTQIVCLRLLEGLCLKENRSWRKLRKIQIL